MKRLILFFVTAMTPMAAPVSAQVPPTFPSPVVPSPLFTSPAFPSPPVTADPRLQTLPYDPGQITRLKVAPGFQLTVIFNAEERVENVAVGDSEAWQVTLNGRGDALFIKPLRADGPTNMTVITDVRVYSFELSPAMGPGPDTPYTVRFQYPSVRSETPAGQVGRYRIGGARPLRPSSVTDDGVRTSIDWGPRQALPAVFAVDDGGREMLVDGYMRDGRYVIDGVHSALIFRLDRDTARAWRLSSGGHR